MIHVKHSRIIAGALGAGIALAFTMGGCGSTPEGRANKAAGPQKSPASGKVVKKMHAGDSWRLTLRNDGKDRTIYVKKSAWIKCQIDDQYAQETCD